MTARWVAGVVALVTAVVGVALVITGLTSRTPVPEPSTLLLIGTGLASAGAWSRTRWFGRKSV